jgi:hypothetical protein
VSAIRILIGSCQVLGLSVALHVAHAGTNPGYVEKKVGDHMVRLPLLPGFAPSCEENSEVSKRMESLTPQTHVFLTCASDLAKWNSFKAGKPPTDFYPLLGVTVIRQPAGGPFTSAEFAKLRDAAHAKLADMLASANERDPSIRGMDQAASANGRERSTQSYQQSMQGFFEAPSSAPSFSFITTRTSSISEAGVTREVREVTANSSVLYSGDVLQLMIVSRAEANADTAVPRDVTRLWLQAFNSLNRSDTK